MLRKLLGTGLLLATLAGCTELEGKTCSADADCASEGGLCDTSVGLCYTEPEVETCTPACAAYEACTTGGCRPRFTELKILTPANNTAVSGATVELSVQLVANPSYASTQHPETLNFTATRNDGSGDVGSFGSVTRTGDTYTVTWTVPTAQTQFTLTATHPIPGAALSASVNVQVDKIAPTFFITLPAAPARTPGGPSQAEQKDPDQLYADAFRRDESVTVTVSANEVVSNASLTVRGIASGGGAGAALAPIAVQPGGTCAGSPPFCGTVTVDLSLPEMKEFRGTMQFQVEGADTAGNRGTASGSLKVTRWKWAFDGLGPIKASPAVGEKGVVYFGTATTAGKVFAIEPNGKMKWAVDVEAVEGSPAVGSFTNNTELVYVASNFTGIVGVGSGTRLRAINYADGNVVSNATCTLSVTAGTPPVVNSAAAITTTTLSNSPVETALIVVSGSHRSAVGMRPTSAGSMTIGCVNSDTSQGMPESSSGGGLVATSGGQFAYPTIGRRIVKYAFGNPTELWTATPGGTSGQEVFGLALLGNNLLGSGGNSFEQGGVFQVSFDSTGAVSPGPLAGTEGGRVYRFAVSADNQAYFGRESASPSTQLTRYNFSPPGVGQTVPDTGVISAAPVLGSDGKLYTLNRAGELAVWSASDLASQWKFSLSATNVEASPTLDCARNGEGTPLGPNLPGVLYVAVGNKLHAFVVDSPRLLKDTNSWPKYQHDARNTGNPATPITNCP
jgi:hypothetical protein